MGVSICLKSFFEKRKKKINMQLFVRGYLGVHTVDVTGFESVESLRNHVCQLEGIDEVENQILNFNGAPLIEEEPLLACGLSELTTIEMTSRLLGGKVHGSPVPAKSRVKRPRWRSKRRRRRRPEGREEESSTTGDSSTLSLLSAERRGPIPTANRLFLPSSVPVKVDIVDFEFHFPKVSAFVHLCYNLHRVTLSFRALKAGVFNYHEEKVVYNFEI